MDLKFSIPDYTDRPHFCAYLKSLPFDKRWEPLRPVLEALFHTESAKDIAKLMLDQYQFNASETQYKYRFNKVWKLRKSVPENVKAAAIRKGKERAKEGKQSIAKYRGRVIPASRFHNPNSIPARLSSLSLRDLFAFRLDELEMFGRYTPFGSNLLLAWNMPFGAQPQTRHVLSPHNDPFSPYGLQSGTTPAGLEMTSPSDSATSPSNALATTSYASNLTPAIREQRVKLFLEGKLTQLLKDLSPVERSDMSKYLSHFWHFSFAMAQNWSPYSMPVDTRKSMARDSELEEASTAFRPQDDSAVLVDEPSTSLCTITPSQICSWTIHIRNESIMMGIDNTDVENVFSQNRLDREVVELETAMQDALANSSFSSIIPSNLAVPLPDLIAKVKMREHDLLSEAISFAVMGRNLDLLCELLAKVGDKADNIAQKAHNARGDRSEVADSLSKFFLDENLSLTHALHLATTYIDGGATCCLIVHQLAETALRHPQMGLGDLRNSNGHTLIDNVLLTILRSHSRVPLSAVDPQLGGTARYRGQEVDICGRWSATSTCFQALIASGEEQVPWLWKHKFCRTAAQAVCHILGILLRYIPLLKRQDSGLFTVRCANPECGQRLTLGPLHVVVMVSYYLMRYGAQGEDLFGMLACYLCLIDAGVDPLTRHEISTSQLLGFANGEVCDHYPQTAAELARALSDRMNELDLTEPCRRGFALFLAVMEETELAIRKVQQIMNSIDEGTGTNLIVSNTMWVFNDVYLEDVWECRDTNAESSVLCSMMDRQISDRKRLRKSFALLCNSDEGCVYFEHPPFANSRKLGHVWAAVQAELCSSAGRGVEGQHMSGSFDTEGLLRLIERESDFDIEKLVDRGLKGYCRCGRFESASDGVSTREDMFVDPSHGLGDNEEAWARTCFIERPVFSEEFYETAGSQIEYSLPQPRNYR